MGRSLCRKAVEEVAVGFGMVVEETGIETLVVTADHLVAAVGARSVAFQTAYCG